uniref:Kinesin motor domain-containing protein n=1 Tax=Salix viminalis TaxID=40686 RepID=A0A6N2LX85_SALVM
MCLTGKNSKLTQILKDSLGDNSKVLMLVHISPCEEDVGETICSLSFANRARAIETYRDLTEAEENFGTRSGNERSRRRMPES